MYNGIINVYKEKGFTSFDVVAKLRGILHQRKIGHTGTLDPEAEGVLPVCLGNGTKLCDLLTDKDKEYEACLHLGIRTDTQDMTGAILEQKAVEVDAERVREVIMSFVGEYDQIPPMYSALKQNGQKLYELARRGITVDRPARRVMIHGIEILEIAIPLVRMRVHCSKGTYIRTLCEDIGNQLGCGGCMESLLRTRVAHFTLDNALHLADIEKLMQENRIDSAVTCVDALFPDYPCMEPCDENAMRGLANGNRLSYEMLRFCGEPADAVRELKADAVGELKADAKACCRDAIQSVLPQCIRVYGNDGRFMAIYGLEDPAEQYYKPVKMFLPE